VPQIDSDLLVECEMLTTSITNIESTNKKITQNNTYKQIQGKLTLFPIPEKPTTNLKPIVQEITSLNTESVELSKTIRDSEAFTKKISALHGTCPTCLQDINEEKISELISEQQVIKENAQEHNIRIKAKLAELDAIQVEVINKNSAWDTANKAKEEWERYHAIIDTTMQEELLDKKELETKLADLQSSIVAFKATIAKIEKDNLAASTHNAKVDIIAKQMVEMNEELETYSGKLHELSERMSIINVLTKTFSTTGLVAYKIECLVKDLEEITNKYLVDLSDGRFQIAFKVSASDKLNVVITDNGRDIEMLALSGGERARVNVATLLAIRKLMQTLSSSRINLLILDETVEALDVDGKERLIEVLLREEHLNTFLVSHGFSHPLLEKINVVKSNNISQIEV
jgi:DNA repair exonuclease SbcCD ATPase subunit